MRFNGRLHKTIEAYLATMKKENCMSWDGEYSPKVNVKMASIIKQCVDMDRKYKEDKV
jgi:hypothetical protein